MRGSVLKRGDKWYIKYDLPRDETGARRVKMQAAGHTRKEAEKALSKVFTELEQGTYSEPMKEALGQFLDRWLNDCAKNRVGSKTFYRYGEIVRLHIKPALGNLPLQALRAPHIQAMYTKSLESGRNGRALSAQTVLHIHRLLHEALEQAVKWRLISRNPADNVDPPKVHRQEMKTWDGEQIIAALDAAEGRWIYMPILIALGTGMRAGEILALQWQDIDFQRGLLTCRRSASVPDARRYSTIEYKSPKSGKGRIITLPASLRDALLSHQENQRREFAFVGKRHTSLEFVITDPDGTALPSMALTSRFRVFLEQTGVPPVRFHDLRHSHATILLNEGANPKVVSERLGHSNIQLTLNTYSHVMPSMQEEAAQKVSGYLLHGQAREQKPIRLEKAS